jgi:hypothetical protein
MRDRKADLKSLRDSEPVTMVVWDELVGPKWSGLRAKDFEEGGLGQLVRPVLHAVGLYSRPLVVRLWQASRADNLSTLQVIIGVPAIGVGQV